MTGDRAEAVATKGYGKGWSEPLAQGRWARFRQRLREPATKNDCALAFTAFWILLVWGVIAIAALQGEQP